MVLYQPKVYVINQSAHDFSAAKKFGVLKYLSRKPISKYATNNIYRMFYEVLKKSRPEDYILITSQNTMNIIATTIFSLIHHKLNLLIHHSEDNTYLERRMSFEDLIESKETRW